MAANVVGQPVTDLGQASIATARCSPIVPRPAPSGPLEITNVAALPFAQARAARSMKARASASAQGIRNRRDVSAQFAAGARRSGPRGVARLQAAKDDPASRQGWVRESQWHAQQDMRPAALTVQAM
jgi:hypothetical protein